MSCISSGFLLQCSGSDCLQLGATVFGRVWLHIIKLGMVKLYASAGLVMIP